MNNNQGKQKTSPAPAPACHWCQHSQSSHSSWRSAAGGDPLPLPPPSSWPCPSGTAGHHHLHQRPLRYQQHSSAHTVVRHSQSRREADS